VLHFPLRSRAQWARKVELQGDAFTKHIDRAGTGYHLTSYDALRRGRIDQQHDAMVVGDAALACGLHDGTLVEDTRIRDALHELRLATPSGGRRFALPSERAAPLQFARPSLVEDAAFAAEASALAESYVVRAQRRLDELERRIAMLEPGEADARRRRR
jgi:hypothetical protein